MKRSISPDFASEAKRFDSFAPPPQFQNHNQQQMHIHQQQQIMAQQQIQAAAAAQQQQFQMQHQIQQQQQQQQQYTSNPPFFNQQAFFPMNSVNMAPFPAAASPLIYNSSPSWNFMSTPPPFFTPTPSTASSTSQPPLPPPELKPEKPPLPKDPEPALGASPNYNVSGMRAPGAAGGLRIRGVNALNGAMYNSFNGSPGGIRGPPPIRQQTLHSPNTGNSPNSPYARNRRRNPHHFPNMNSHQFFSRMDAGHLGDYNEISQFNEEEQPAGPEKLTIFPNEKETGQVQVNKKAKRKPMSTRYSRAKEWVREDADAALALEREYSRAAKRQMLILKFPDPDLNKYIVKKYSPFIESVHFQQPSTPRYCFVQLKKGADTAKVLEEICEIPFGTGKIVAEPKTQPAEDHVVSPEEIDPYTLYIGNLPTSISVKAVKTHFPSALRIDIGYAQRMRYTRYAFVRYNSVEEAMKAYRNTVNAQIESRSLIVRFRRQKGNIGLPGETKTNNPQREDRVALPTTRTKQWDDADDDDYHEDENVFMLDEIEEDDDEIDLDEEALNSSRANRLAFGTLHPKDEIDKDKNDEAAETLNEKQTNEKMRKKQTEGTKTSDSQALNEGLYQESTGVTSKTNLQEDDILPAVSNVKATNSTAPNSTELLEDRLDTKDNVLDKANELLNTTAQVLQKAESPDCICTDPPEKTKKIFAEAVKVEHSGDESSSDIEGVNLLGTRVKDEFSDAPERVPTPTMEDIYLDDYEYDDMDEEPEEEDDDWADTSLSTRTTNWEEVRRRELNAKEDKPDLDKLAKITDTLPSVAKVLPIEANLEPKSEFEKLYNARQINNISDTIGETDDLHDMFAEMNSDLDEDDDDQF